MTEETDVKRQMREWEWQGERTSTKGRVEKREEKRAGRCWRKAKSLESGVDKCSSKKALFRLCLAPASPLSRPCLAPVSPLFRPCFASVSPLSSHDWAVRGCLCCRRWDRCSAPPGWLCPETGMPSSWPGQCGGRPAGSRIGLHTQTHKHRTNTQTRADISAQKNTRIDKHRHSQRVTRTSCLR